MRLVGLLNRQAYFAVGGPFTELDPLNETCCINGEQGLAYLNEIAKIFVETFVQHSNEQFLEPKMSADWTPDWQDENTTTQLPKYETDWSLDNNIGHGDTIRDVVEMFRGDRVLKGVPPDRGRHSRIYF